ncbi:MAG: LytR/AlgR family response regulator transcription factor [Velocimicrobium sp.]
MLKIAICDDEITELSRISKLLNRYHEQKNAAFRYDVFSNPIELLESLQTNSYDILLLDVLMPGINGIAAAQEIRGFNQTIKIIFLTSSPEFAVESYAVDAYYYLLKPTTETRLFPILDKLFFDAQNTKEYLYIKSASGIMRISFHNLEFLEVMNKKLYFHLTDGNIKEVYGSLSDYEPKLLNKEEFIKVHRSIIVNMKHTQELHIGTITTATGQSIPISRLLYPKVRELYMNYLFLEKGVE